MKRMLIAGGLLIAAAGQVLAADLPRAAAPLPRAPATYVPTTAPVYNWGGVYIGINGGYGFGSSEWSAAGVTTGNFNTSGGLVGGTIGANFQASQFVLGVEGDIDWTDISGNSVGGCGTLGAAAVPPVPATTTCKTSNDWLGTIRGRVGYAFDRVLVFATGGGAFGNVQAVTPLATNSNSKFGWTAGAGVEVAFTENLTAKVEYLFVDLQDGSCTTACGAPTTVAVKFDASLVRAGLNYKFGGF
jgi:outer membrane immunogenic protein